MDEQNTAAKMLELLSYPGFAVQNGKIIHVNEAAQSRFIEPGANISELLLTGHEEYSQFTDGSLYLSLSIAGSKYDATVLPVADIHLFLLEHEPSRSELQALAVASQHMRIPLADVLSASGKLINANNDKNAADNQSISQLNRGVYQLLRQISNMSDAARYLECSQAELVSQDVTAIFEEVMEKSATLLAEMHITLLYHCTEQPVYAAADKERLERAIYNLVSNAVKFCSKDAVLKASLTRKKDMLYFTLADPGEGVPSQVRGNMFHRFLRTPGLEDPRYGTGLGMVIVHAAAAAHGGTVLVENPAEGGTRVTLTLKLRHSGDTVVRSSAFSIDYAGGHDHGLLELSDVLPESVFNKYL